MWIESSIYSHVYLLLSSPLVQFHQLELYYLLLIYYFYYTERQYNHYHRHFSRRGHCECEKLETNLSQLKVDCYLYICGNLIPYMPNTCAGKADNGLDDEYMHFVEWVEASCNGKNSCHGDAPSWWQLIGRNTKCPQNGTNYFHMALIHAECYCKEPTAFHTRLLQICSYLCSYKWAFVERRIFCSLEQLME